MRQILLVLSSVCLVVGCSPSPPSESNDLRDAAQKPINATLQAVDQVQDTQNRLDAAMNNTDGAVKAAASKDAPKDAAMEEANK